MTRHFRHTLVCLSAAAALATAPALAADATPEGAAKLIQTLQKYVGTPAAGEPSSVTVTPKGQDYQLVFDIQRLMKPLEVTGLRLDSTPMNFVLTEQADGTWRVVSDSYPHLNIHVPPDQVMDFSMEGYKSDGIFDPRTAAFRSGRHSMEKMTAKTTAPGVTQLQTYGPSRLELTGTAVGVDAVSVAFRQSGQNYVQEAAFAVPGKDGKPAAPAANLTIKAASFELGVSADAVRNTKIMELWAYFVAHPSMQAITDSQADLKALLRDCGPVFEKLTESFSASGVSVAGPTGTVSFKDAAFALDIGGISSSGTVGLSLKSTGLTIPPPMIPAWGPAFVPSLIDLAPRVTGLNFAAAAREAVEDFDLHKAIVLTGAETTKIAFLLAPGGSFKVSLPPGRLTSSLLDIQMDGELDVTVPKASGKLNVHAKGLDAALEALKAVMGSDKSAAQAFGGLTIAKALAKPDADGGLQWVLEMTPDGRRTVNGTPMGGVP